jgi:hypothetical protein
VGRPASDLSAFAPIARFGWQVRVEYPHDTFLDAPPELRLHYTRIRAEPAHVGPRILAERPFESHST